MSSPYCFCPLLCPTLHEMSLGISNFPEEISSLSHSIVFLFLCIDHLRRISYLSLLFFGTLHSDGYIFPFLLCLSFSSFPEILLDLYISRFVSERSLQHGNTSGKEQKNPPKNPTLSSQTTRKGAASKTEIF